VIFTEPIKVEYDTEFTLSLLNKVGLSLSRIAYQVCLEPNGFFLHPRVVWKLLETGLTLWAFRACTGCKEPKWCSR